MDFSLSEDQLALVDSFDRFCREKVAPRAKKADAEGKLDPALWEELADIGYFGLFFPEELGGSGVDMVTSGMAQESLAKACASTFLSAGASIGLCGGPLARFGSDEIKEKWLKPMMAGKAIGCFALTEPGAGTDAAAIKCRAVKTEGGYLLNGEKALITNAPTADVALVMAVTDPEAGPHGVTSFAVDLNQEGVARTAPYAKMGLRASPTGGLTFTDVKLAEKDVVGQEGMGFIQAMQTLEMGRLGMSHFGIGIALAALEMSMKYAMEREAFGKPIAKKQAVHFKIADMKIEIDAAQLLARRVAWLKDRDEPCQDLASISKTYATEMACRVTDWAVQIHGGWGYTDEFEVERLYRDARLGPIGEGTSEIQRELIARSLLNF
jgi:alkylation response protein AidB-like acyl-CoA dehydrogenase